MNIFDRYGIYYILFQIHNCPYSKSCGIWQFHTNIRTTKITLKTNYKHKIYGMVLEDLLLPNEEVR